MKKILSFIAFIFTIGVLSGIIGLISFDWKVLLFASSLLLLGFVMLRLNNKNLKVNKNEN